MKYKFTRDRKKGDRYVDELKINCQNLDVMRVIFVDEKFVYMDTVEQTNRTIFITLRVYKVAIASQHFKKKVNNKYKF